MGGDQQPVAPRHLADQPARRAAGDGTPARDAAGAAMIRSAFAGGHHRERSQSAALPALMAATDPVFRGDEFYGPKRVIGGSPIQQELWPPLTALNEAGRLWEESERLVGARFAVAPTD